MEQVRTFAKALAEWETLHSLGKKSTTQKFNREIVAVIRKHWPEPWQSADSVNPDALLSFGQTVAHYCPSRWNAIVSALRFVTAGASQFLKPRRPRFRQFNPPSQAEFASLLNECDRDSRSRAGLVVRFLSLTGVRITEARSLLWANVHRDWIEVPGNIAKNGVSRCVPKIDGLESVLERLRAFGGPFILPRENCRRAIKAACARAGLQPMSPHSFRHLFATRCIESGVDVPTVARWLGHQDGGALLSRTYFHLIDEHSRLMAQRVTIAV